MIEIGEICQHIHRELRWKSGGLPSPFDLSSTSQVVDMHVINEKNLWPWRKKWKDEDSAEKKSLRQFVQPENGWPQDFWKDWFCAIDDLLCSLENDRNWRLSHEEEFWSKSGLFTPLSLSNRSPLFGAWGTTVVSVCTWLAGCPMLGAWSTSDGSSWWV